MNGIKKIKKKQLVCELQTTNYLQTMDGQSNEG